MIGGAKGIGIGLDFGIGNIKRPTKRDTLDPAIKEALCGVWIADQNTNESPTRNIIKNKLKDKGGDFEILNAAYNLNSGYGKYNYDYTTFDINKKLVKKINSSKIEYFAIAGAVGFYTRQTNTYVGKIKITGLTKSIELGKVDRFQIYGSGGTPFVTKTDGIFDINVTFGTDTVNMYVVPKENYSGNLDSPIYIEQVPEYQGAFCTDGVDDLIVSQKPANEMLGGSNEFTVVSMIHQISFRTNNNDSLNNQIRPTGDTFIRNVVTASNKTGIYGYTSSNLNNSLYNNTVVNNILGDKNDYANSFSLETKTDGLFSVEGYKRNDGYFAEVNQVAWYWTFIAKRALTTDEINQVIAYYNLDKYVAPDIYYDVKKQGLTNENHAEFGDKLIDYSGNGKDMQLYNFGWKLDSGVGKYEVDFMFYSTNNSNVYKSKTSNSISAQSTASFAQSLLFKYTSKDGGDSDLSEYNIKVDNLIGNIYYRYINTNGIIQEFQIRANGIYTLPKSFISLAKQQDWYGFIIGSNSSVTITQLPSYENALVFDGVDDYGLCVGDLGLKDYTVVADRAYVELIYRQFPFVSNNKNDSNTPFIMEYSVDIETHTNPFSYGNRDSVAKPIDKNRKVSYQSTYVYNGNTITKGTSTNTGDGLAFSRYHVNDPYTKLCLYNFMLFPYSLSEFLIERQLKKRKLGTLHPVVKFNPIIEGNVSFEILKYEKVSETGVHNDLQIGDYIPIGQEICISIKLGDSTSKLSKVTSSSLTDINFGMPPNLPFGSIYGKVTGECPQVIILYIENNQQGGGEPVIDFTTWIKGNKATMTCTPTTVHLTNMIEEGMVIETKSSDLILPSIKVRVSGVQKGRGIAFQYNKPDGTFNLYWCETDGEHTIPSSVHTEKQQYTIIKTNFAGDCDILIEVLT